MPDDAERETDADAEAAPDAGRDRTDGAGGAPVGPIDAAAVGRAYLDTRPWDLLTDLTAIGGRMGGSEGERRAAELVADALRAAGVGDVRFEPFETNRWTRGTTTFDLLAPVERSFEAVALPYSPPGTIEGELVDVGYGTPVEIDRADVRDAVVVASTTTPPGSRFVHRMEKFGYALDAGAAGFVFVNHVPGQLPPTGALRFGEEAAAPAVGVSKETGGWLREYAREGTPTGPAVDPTPSAGGDVPSPDGDAGRVRYAVDAETDRAESRNVVGHVGPDTDEELVLVAHYDGHDIADGALDNGCGVATVLVAARILAASADDLPIGVRVALVGCEETGLTGSERLADDLDLDRVRAVVNVDGAGRHRQLVAMSHTSGATRAAAERVGARTHQPIDVDPEPHPFSDQWPFVRRGVPALQLHSDGGERGRGWGHTHADTRDKVDDRNVREHGVLAALLVAELARTDVPRLDRGELQASFRAAEFEPGMRAAGLWPEDWD